MQGFWLLKLTLCQQDDIVQIIDMVSSDWRGFMSIAVNLRYKGENGAAKKFAEEMISSGTVQKIREEAGNLRYEYYTSFDDPETLLLIDSWENQEAIDVHHASPMMAKIAELREKYDLHMTVERFTSDALPEQDQSFIRK